jgi:hypothetical protein
MIHASGLLHGEAFIWPDARLSAAGRKLIAAQELRDQFARGQRKVEVEI